MKDPSRVRLSGPLQEFGPGFVGELERQGYSPLGATLQVRLMARVSGWMQAEGLVCGELTGEVVERFLAERRAAGRRDYVTARAMAPLLGYLRELRVVPLASASRPSTRAEMLGERFCALPDRRAWSCQGDCHRVCRCRPAVLGRARRGRQLDLRHLRAGRVTAFVVGRCPGQSRGAAKMTVTALRSLLGFLHVEGLIGESLLGAVPSVASWRLSGLPRLLEPDQVQALLDSCDQQTGGRAARPRDPDAAGAARAARRRGRRAAARRPRLACGRAGRGRQGPPRRAAAAACRCRRGDHWVSV